MKRVLHFCLLVFCSASLLAQTPGISPRAYDAQKALAVLGWESSQYESYEYLRINPNGAYERLPFRILPPKIIKSSTLYPMVVMLHGKGEAGENGVSDNFKQLYWGGKTHLMAVNAVGDASVPDNRKFDGFVLFPQEPQGSWTNYPDFNAGQVTTALSQMWELVDLLKTKYPIDPDRIVVHGLSSGGTGSWASLYHRPDLFARALPMSAPGDLSQMEKIAPIPLWLFQGGKDVNPRNFISHAVIQALRNAGAVDTNLTRYTEYPNVEHDAWINAYEEPDFFPYLLAADKKKISVLGKNPICPGEETKLALSPGFNAYQWYKDGQLLVGQTANKLTQVTTAGQYQVKFKRYANSVAFENSLTVDISLAPVPVKPTVLANESVLLPSPSGANTVTLSASLAGTTYLWSTAAVTKSISVATSGTYNVKVINEFGCASPVSDNVVVKVGLSGPVPLAPTNLAATALSPASVRVDWSDNATNETAYEVYSAAASGGPYAFEKVVAANTTSAVLENLHASTDYFFKVRAITATNAALSTTYATTKTLKDLLPPGIPQNLELSAISAQGLVASWNVAPDEYGVKQYIVYNGAAILGYATQPTFTITPLVKGTNYAISVKAEDYSGNISEKSAVRYLNYTGQGLFAALYKGYYSTLPDFSTLSPIKLGLTLTQNPSPADLFFVNDVYNEDIIVPNTLTGADFVSSRDSFAIRFSGYMYLPTAGNYTFFLSSDDGSTLSINNTLVINNDLLYGTKDEKSGTYNFGAAGWYPILVNYAERGGGQFFQLKYQKPGSSSKEIIPSTSYATTSGGITPIAETALVTSNFTELSLTTAATDKIRTEVALNFSSAPDASVKSFEIYRAKSNANPSEESQYNLITTIVRNGNSQVIKFKDTTETPGVFLTPNTRYYYAVKLIGTNAAAGFHFPQKYNSDFRSVVTPATAITPPQKPENLVLTAPVNGVSKLTFTDKSTNESGFELWRSLDQNGPFALVALIPANQSQVNDNNATGSEPYYYKLRAYNAGGFSDFVSSSGTSTPLTFYLKSTGDLNVLASWSANSDGTGATPANFTANNQTFVIANRVADVVLASNWTVSGTSAKVVVSPSMKLILNAGATLAGNLEVGAGALVDVKSATVPGILSADPSSVIKVENTSAFAVTETGHLQFITTGVKTLLSDTIYVKGDLTVSSAVKLVGKPTVLKITGSLLLPDNLPEFEKVEVYFDAGNHQITNTGGTLSLAALIVNHNGSVTLPANGTNLKLGSSTGGGLFLRQNASLNIANGILTIQTKGALNPENKSGTVASTGGSIVLTTSSTLASYLKPAKDASLRVFTNLTNNSFGGAKLSLTDVLSLTGTLKLQAGILETNGFLTLVSNLNGTARITKVEAGAALSGTITWQRLIGPNKVASQYFLGTPIKNKKVTDLKPYISVSGLDPNQNSTVSLYNEVSNNWKGITNPNELMVPGKGYRTLVKASDLTYPGNSGYYEHVGAPVIGNGINDNTAPFIFNVTNSGTGKGFNLLANPYPCEIDFEATTGWNKTNIDNSFYVWDGVTKGYKVFKGAVDGVPSVNTGVSSVIAAGQGFIVRSVVPGNSTVSVTEDVKTTSASTPVFFRTEEAIPQLRLTLDNGTVTEDAIIRFVKLASQGLDKFDSPKLTGNVLNISSFGDGIDLTVNTLPYTSAQVTVPLHVQVSQAGSYTITFGSIETFTSSVELYLRDKETNVLTNMRVKPSYTFNAAAAFNTSVRFEVVLKNLPEEVITALEKENSLFANVQLYPNPAHDKTSLYLTLANPAVVGLELITTHGDRAYATTQQCHSGENAIHISAKEMQLPAGIYFYQLNSGNSHYKGKLVIQ